MLHELVAAGADIATRPRTSNGRVHADLVLAGTELATLTARGARLVQVVQRAGEGTARYRASVRGARGINAADTLHVLQASWWTSNGQTFLQTQVATTASDDPDVEITVSWRTADGVTGTFELFRFEDADEYQYHVARGFVQRRSTPPPAATGAAYHPPRRTHPAPRHPYRVPRSRPRSIPTRSSMTTIR